MSEQIEMTPEEIKERKEALLKYYEEQTLFLEKQLTYEKLLTDIEEQRAKRIQLQAAVASFLAPDEEEDEDVKPMKTLKRKD